ncbi:hypothetical protein NPIL_215021 [Nephila pilipes]|uniref:Reverse transcriptase/retrotransposon-derived protein RNase H-like domain-containing protein n=1 Tax=Nephila pilipes TaxID=299642 RepID=A0A8X6NN07_NEPPI|nr:hypothetical protein NPIL_215021 [Nephila pilipes]
MAAVSHTSSIHAIDAENQGLKPMLMDISSRLSHLETRGLDRSFRCRSASRNSEYQEHCWYTILHMSKVLRSAQSHVPSWRKTRAAVTRLTGWRQFIPHAARTRAVLYSYLKRAKKMTEHQSYGQKIPMLHLRSTKKDLAEATVLYHPAAEALLTIVVDASDTAVGAILHLQVPKE